MGRAAVSADNAPRTLPLLRWPPFPGASMPTGPAPEASPVDREILFVALREARVGSAFWGEAREANSSEAVLHARTKGEADTASADLGLTDPCLIAAGPDAPVIDPWSILPDARHLIAHGGDEWIAIAAILGLQVTVLTPGPYGSPSDSAEALSERAFEALSSTMPDPFSDAWLEPLDAIALLTDWRRVLDGNRGGSGERIVAACGMSWWKREEIRRFLWSPGKPLKFLRANVGAVSAAAQAEGAIAIWPSRVSRDLELDATANEVPLVRVEDGFVRSVGLGSNLVPPLSVIVDRQGIHFDPSRPSDLETILVTTTFTKAHKHRAAALRKAIVEAGISKYGAGHKPAKTAEKVEESKRLVLVPGQVENDMSVLAGGGGLTSNLELLKRTRALEPDAEIWWRPHPDVDVGHRVGAVEDEAALEFADRIVREGSMSELLAQVDALHTLTSLSGFEALMRGVEVTCHGVPFYSGWGLTRDLGDVPDRRGRVLSLDELVAGVLVLYPRYLDPVTGLPCPPEILIRRLADGEASNRLGWVEPIRRIQGRIMRRLRPTSGR